MRWTSEAAPDPFAGREAHRFGRPQTRARGPRLPVIVVTGFLAAGKTPLIRRLLERPEARNSIVIVNELGEIGIDQALIAEAGEPTVLIGNGCACCAVTGAGCACCAYSVSSRDRSIRVLIARTGLAVGGDAKPARGAPLTV